MNCGSSCRPLRRHALRAVFAAGFDLFRDEDAIECAVAVGLAFFANGADAFESAQRVLHLAQRDRVFVGLRVGGFDDGRAQVARADAKMRIAVIGDGMAEEEPVERRIVRRKAAAAGRRRFAE